MALAELSVVNNEIVIEVGGTALLAPLVAAAAASATAAEGFKDAAEAAAEAAAADVAAALAADLAASEAAQAAAEAAAVDAQAAVSVFGGPADYANAGGTGDRTASITVTISPPLTSNTNSNLVDGATANNTTDSIGLLAVSVAGLFIRFDFGVNAAKVIQEARWKQSGTSTHGSWKWQASRDATTWVDIGVAFTLGGATAQLQTELAANATGYRYYQLLGVSGTASAAVWVQEVEFELFASILTGYAPVESIFPTGFPVSKLVEAYFFDEASGTTVKGVKAGLNINLAGPTSPNATLTGKSVRLAAGLIETPSLLAVRSQTILYRTDRGGTAGYLISGGASSGAGSNQQGVTAAETHKVFGFGLDPFTLPMTASGGSCWALNRGGWTGYHREDTAARNSIYGLGGRHSTTTSRCADFEINCAFFWNDTLTSDELAAVYLYIRQRAAKKGIWLHRSDPPVRGDLYFILGESNADGRSLIANLSAGDQAANYRHTKISSGLGAPVLNFDTFELGYNQKYPTVPQPVATHMGPEIGIATERRTDQAIVSMSVLPFGPAIIIKNGVGGTRLAPSSVGGTSSTTWSIAELKSGGLFWQAWGQAVLTGLQQAIASGIGWNGAVKVGLWLGLNDAVSTTYASSAATYQGYLQALWDEIKAQLPGCTCTLTAFRPHTSDPASDATALSNIRTAYGDFDTANADVTVIDTDAYAKEADLVHYNAASNKIMGALLHG